MFFSIFLEDNIAVNPGWFLASDRPLNRRGRHGLMCPFIVHCPSFSYCPAGWSGSTQMWFILLGEAIFWKIPEFWEIISRGWGGGGVNRISYLLFRNRYLFRNTVKIRKGFHKWGGHHFMKLFCKFRYFLKDCFPYQSSIVPRPTCESTED